MPNSYINIPFITPIKFYPVNVTPGIHFDDDFFYNQIKSFETKACYFYKAQLEDQITIQVSASSMPGDIQVYNGAGIIQTGAVSSFVLKISGGALGYNIYETSFKFSDFTLPEGIYYLYSTSNLLGTNFSIISEPISAKTEHANTLLFSYKNSYNDFGVIFTTGIVYNFRCEAGIMDFLPESDIIDYVDQVRNVQVLSGIPYRQYKLYIGTAPGVAPYIIDTLNRIFCCDHVVISKDGTNTKQYVKPTSSKWEVTRVKPWPLQGWATDILEGKNLSGIQINTIIDPLNIGMVNSFNIETNFFGQQQDALIETVDIIN